MLVRDNMYTSLVLFRNELKNRQIPLYKIVGIISVLLLSKEIFPHNEDIKEFLANVLSLSFREYVFRSRTLLVARVTRAIISKSENKEFKRKLYDFIDTNIEKMKKEKNIKENNKLDGWM